MQRAVKTFAPYAAANVDPDAMRQACLVLATLLRGEAIPESLWSEKQLAERRYTWRPALPRELRPGDVVRVRDDTFPRDSVEAKYNGREGTVSAIRDGVVVHYGGGGMGVRQKLAHLDVRVTIRREVTK